MNGKLPITLEIEEHLIRKFGVGRTRWAREVAVKNDDAKHGKSDLGYVDFLTAELYKHDFGDYIPFITCYEIKVSFNDFKSLHGHNFIGDENYYVMPTKLLEEILEKDASLIHDTRIGIYVYDKKRMYLKRKPNICTWKYACRNRLSIEDRFRIMDTLLMQWVRGTN